MHKSVSITIESFQRLQEIKHRILEMEPSKLPDNIRILIAQGTNACSVVGVALELLEQRLEEADAAPVVRKTKRRQEPTKDDEE